MDRSEYSELFAECLEPEILERYSPGSHKKVGWKCSVCGHMWITEIRVRTHGCGCPHCNNGDPISLDMPARRSPQSVRREKSLGYLYPELVEMWDDSNEYDIFHYKPGSGEEARWRCSRCGHRFRRAISEMTASVHHCPKCVVGYGSSFGEQFIYFACVEAFGDSEVLLRDKTILGFEVDVLIPKRHIGVEYGAWKWHRDRTDDDKRKTGEARKKGIELCCVYDGVAVFNETLEGKIGHAFYIQGKTSYEDYDAIKRYLISVIGVDIANIDWDIAAEKAKIAMHEKPIPYEKSFECKYPASVEEWDYEKNYPIIPSQVMAHSEQNYHFICEQGHSYSATPEHKTTRGDGCPICRHRQIIPGVNSFAVENPHLMPYWDWKRNSENPDTISPSSNAKKKWYWKCPDCGHEWETSRGIIASHKELSCPVCPQRKGLLDIIDMVHFGHRKLDYAISSSILVPGDIKDEEYRNQVENLSRNIIQENKLAITGNNKFWIVETSNIYIRISKDKNSLGVIQQCYILDSPLGEKTLLDKKGKAVFANVKSTDVSFAARHPELMPYWDWSKNELEPHEMPDNPQVQKIWHWKCPDCGYEWTSTAPIRCGGTKTFICRNCHIRERVEQYLNAGKLRFYDVYALNNQRHIVPNDNLLNIIHRIVHGEGEVDMDAQYFYLTLDSYPDECAEGGSDNNSAIVLHIKKNTGVIAHVSGIDCPERPREDPRRLAKRRLSENSSPERG